MSKDTKKLSKVIKLQTYVKKWLCKFSDNQEEPNTPDILLENRLTPNTNTELLNTIASNHKLAEGKEGQDDQVYLMGSRKQ